jgi:hypothetical protein
MPQTCGPKIGHVRVCEDSGWVTARFYSATIVLARALDKAVNPRECNPRGAPDGHFK